MSPPTTTGLRERKKVSTRSTLTARGLQLALDRGYHGFTIAELVEQVGVSRRTFSNYFTGKAECLAAISDHWLDESLSMIAALPARVPLAELVRTVLAGVAEQIVDEGSEFFGLVAAEPELQAAMSAGDARHAQRIAGVIAERTNLPDDDVRIALLAGFCLSAGAACTGRWIARGRAGGQAGLAAELDSAFSLIDLTSLTR